MRIEATLSRDGRVLAQAIETDVGREIYVSRPGMARLPVIRAALDTSLSARAAGVAIDAICRETRERHVAWRHREDDPLLRDEVRLHWAPGATRQWREEEKWLPEGHMTLTVEIMTNAAGVQDTSLAA